MLRNILKIIGIFILGIAGGIFANQILWPYFAERPLFYQSGLEKPVVYLREKKEIIIQENTALKNAIEKVEKTVIGVKTETPKGKVLEGSGLIVASDGLVVTLAELVPRGAKFSFFVEGEKVRFQILKRDLKENLALIKIEKSNLPTVSFANLEKLNLGERIFLVGIIFEKDADLAGAGPYLKKNVNEGIVKSFDENFIKTNITEKEALSGSPLFNIEGELLGLNIIEDGKVVTIPITKIKKFSGF